MPSVGALGSRRSAQAAELNRGIHMSSTPEWDSPGQWGGAQQGAEPGEATGAPSGQGGPEAHPSAGERDDWAAGGPGQQWSNQGWTGQPGYSSPVNIAETRVTGRRVIQYIIDSFLAGIIPGIAFWLFDRGHGVFHSLGWLFSVLIWVVVMIWYWVVRPTQSNGQTFAMKWMGLRVISKLDGGPASMTQMFVRWIGLIFDSWLLTPLVGYITILFSRYRQRIGDHMAKTLVVSTGYAHYTTGPRYAGQR